jgi:hypothetical protein
MKVEIMTNNRGRHSRIKLHYLSCPNYLSSFLRREFLVSRAINPFHSFCNFEIRDSWCHRSKGQWYDFNIFLPCMCYHTPYNWYSTQAWTATPPSVKNNCPFGHRICKMDGGHLRSVSLKDWHGCLLLPGLIWSLHRIFPGQPILYGRGYMVNFALKR